MLSPESGAAESREDRQQMTRITLISEAKGRRPHSVEAVERAVGSRAEAIAPRLGRRFLKNPSLGGILLTWREKCILSLSGKL